MPGGLDRRRASLQGWAMFTLDPAFSANSTALASLPLCEARLQLDARFPWIILVPRVSGASELEDLRGRDRHRLIDEIVLTGRAVRAIGDALGHPVEKLNVGALGNITTQLHVHVVGRRRDDAAWPGPVWGAGVATAHAARELELAARVALAILEAGTVGTP